MAGYNVRAYIDTNVLIDYLVSSRQGASDSHMIFQAAKDGRIEIFISTQSFIDAEYIISRAPGFDRKHMFDTMLKLMSFVNIGHINWTDLRSAILNYSGDFEDDAQYSAADFEGCDIIVTSDRAFSKKQTAGGPLIMTPAEFVAKMS